MSTLHHTLSMKHIVKQLWFELLFRFGATTWAKWRLRKYGAVVVLTFHRVLANSQFDSCNSPRGMVVRHDTFDDTLEYISGHFDVVAISGAMPRGSRSRFAITFDDGWLDNYENAAPALLRRRLPACIFLCPNRVGTVGPYWPEKVLAILKSIAGDQDRRDDFRAVLQRAGIPTECGSSDDLLDVLKSLPTPLRKQILDELSDRLRVVQDPTDRTMDWHHIQLLRQSGIAFGSHTARHEILTLLESAYVRTELVESKRAIEHQLGESILAFSYPNGSWNDTVKQQVKECGYELAFINDVGAWSESTDPLLIPRSNLSESKLTGLNGKFSAAAFEYFSCWLPYCNRKRSTMKSYPKVMPLLPAEGEKNAQMA